MYCDVEKELAALEKRAGYPVNPVVREFMAYCLNVANNAYSAGYEAGFKLADGGRA